MAATPDAGGYWFVASDGGVFNFGDAAFLGSGAATTGKTNASSAVGIASTKDGLGYWVAFRTNNEVDEFGDATGVPL
jgi:hypothetical protein